MEHRTCTGIAAVWCANCGSCTCPTDDEGSPVERVTARATIERPWASFERVVDVDCPLHGVGSAHAVEDAP